MKRYRSKTVAAWVAVIGGVFGLHRFYVHGCHDALGWLFPPPALAGIYGLHRLDALGQDDRLAWVLLPLLGLTLSIAMLGAIVYALTPDELWDRRHNPGQPTHATRWGPILAAIVALLLGATALMSAVSFGIQKLFEAQI